MSDVADMLGVAGKATTSISDEAQRLMGDKAKITSGKPGKKPKGMSREVFDLLGKDGLVPATQGNVVAPNFKNKRANALKGKWIWTAITSSARERNDPVFFHWIKADQSYTDYPYASFNVKFETFECTDEEYENVFTTNSSWSKADTLTLIATCHQYDMRWAIIADRIELSTPRSVEDMQERYYFVRAAIRARRTDSSNTEEVVSGYDVERERKRRRAQDMVFKKTKDDEIEELQLREELKHIDAAIKKNKKMKVAPATQEGAAAGSSSGNTKAGAVSVIDVIPVAMGAGGTLVARSILAPAADVPAGTGKTGSSSAAPTVQALPAGPTPGRPALQSSRLYSGIVPPVSLIGAVGDIGVTKLDIGQGGASLSKKMMLKMCLYLRELDVPETPLPTRAVCDLVEAVKRDTVTLLSLHNVIAKKEKDVAQLSAGAADSAAANKGKAAPRSLGGKVGAASSADSQQIEPAEGGYVANSHAGMVGDSTSNSMDVVDE